MLRAISTGLVLSVLVLLSPATRADAEVFLDLYAGYSLTQDEDVDTRVDGMALSFHDVDFDDSYVVGGRVGYWFETLPFFGLGLDVSYFRPDIDGQGARTSAGIPARLGGVDLEVITVGPQLLVKLPIPVVKPYVFSGPAVFVTQAEDRGGSFGVPGGDTDVDAAIGFKGGAGIRFVFFGFLGVFAEYQFTYASPELEFQRGGIRRKLETDLKTHHGVIGVTFQF